MSKMSQHEQRTTVTEQDDSAAIATLHRAWRRDMAKALGAVDTAKAAVASMEAASKVIKLKAGDGS